MINKAFYVIILSVKLFLIKEVKNLEEILSKNMKNKLGTQSVNNNEKIRISYIIATLANMIGGSSYNAENDEIAKQVEEIQKSETKDYIKNLEKRMLQSYKEGKAKTQKGPKIKKAEIKEQDLSKIKEMQASKKETRESDREREER